MLGGAQTIMSVRRAKSSAKRNQTSLVLPIAQQMGELEKAKQEGVAMRSKIRSVRLLISRRPTFLVSLPKKRRAMRDHIYS